MADYIYLMETRLTPDQQRAAAAVQSAAQAAGMNIYLTGGAVRDLITGFPIRDIDFTVQGNALKLQKELEKAGAQVRSTDEDTRSVALLFPGNVRAEVQMARSERFEKPGKPIITAATIIDDLRRRDFTVNAMALSLNAASRGLLLDPANGVADAEAKVLRVLHNYSFLEEPSRLIRATRFLARFHWQLEERTQARYDAAKENEYIQNISNRAIGYEIEQIPYEEDPLHVMKALEKDDWLKVLHPHWSTAKIDAPGLSRILKVKQQLSDMGFTLDAAAAVMYFLTSKLNSHDIAEIQKLIPHKEFVNAWRGLEDDAKELAKKLTSKEAATPSRTWQLLKASRAESILFLEATSRQQAVAQKIKNFLTKWPMVRQKLPLAEMAELLITPELPDYPKLSDEAFLLLLDGKLRSRTEILKFLKPYAPPPPPPPPPPAPKRGRAAKAEAAAAAAAAPAAAVVPAKGKGKKGKAAAAQVPPPPPVQPAASPKKTEVAAKKTEPAAKKPEPGKKEAVKPAPPAKAAAPAKTAAPAKKEPPKKAAKPAANKPAKKKH
jgi:tRNA nucleotidyltransferase (CCA-adding enzyme)